MRRGQAVTSVLAHLLLAVSCVAAWTVDAVAAVPYASAKAIHYPRRMLRLTLLGNGSPLLRADGTLDSLVCDSVARYDVVSAYAPPLKARPDIVQALLRRNPGIVLLATLPGGVWENPHPALGDTTTDLAWARWRVIRDHDAFHYGTGGGWFSADDNVDRSDHRAALALAGVDARAVVPGVAGLWLDTLCDGRWWLDHEPVTVDWKRAGFSCWQDWARAYREGHRIYVERLRVLVGDAILVGNCGPEGEQGTLNGWMREGFPFQNGGSWRTNMLGFDGHPGYLTENYVRPHLSILSGFRTGISVIDRQRFLFGLASATLGDGVFEQVGAGWNNRSFFYWPPEFDLDLGVPRARAYQNGATTFRRDFSRGFVEVNYAAMTGRIVAR